MTEKICQHCGKPKSRHRGGLGAAWFMHGNCSRFSNKRRHCMECRAELEPGYHGFNCQPCLKARNAKTWAEIMAKSPAVPVQPSQEQEKSGA